MGLETVTYSELTEFIFEGTRLPLKDRVRGIWKPAVMQSALSITTTYRPPGVKRPYEDLISAEDYLLSYKWDGKNEEQATNRAVRAAMHTKAPLIWFSGVGKGVFKAIFPVFVLREEKASRQFLIDVGSPALIGDMHGPAEEFLRNYLRVESRKRAFQAVFRGTVMRAYAGSCALCNLQHTRLLDAAHIIPDSDAAGIASVVNALALCKIHHAAFDSGMLGIRPDLVVQIRPDILQEIDGPMLKHGLQEMHGRPLMAIPRSRVERPRTDILELAFDRFRQSA
jgi:putative restriction endonuclease